MKLVTADFKKEDVDVLNKLVAMMRERQPDITLKKYLKLCVLSYTDAVLQQLNKELANNAEVQGQEHGDRVESSSDNREGNTVGTAGSPQ
jgi:dynactin complex subunit